MDIAPFIYPCVSWWAFGCFHSAIMNNAAPWTFVYKLLRGRVFSSSWLYNWEYNCKGHITALCSTLWGTIFQSACTIFTYQEWERAPVLTRPWYVIFCLQPFLSFSSQNVPGIPKYLWESQEAPGPSSPSGCPGRSPQGSFPRTSVHNLCPRRPRPAPGSSSSFLSPVVINVWHTMWTTILLPH